MDKSNRAFGLSGFKFVEAEEKETHPWRPTHRVGRPLASDPAPDAVPLLLRHPRTQTAGDHGLHMAPASYSHFLSVREEVIPGP